MLADIWNGFRQALSLGLVGGLAVGILEGLRLWSSGPGRAGALEAAVYSVVINSLAGGALAGLASALLTGLARGARTRPSPGTLGALYLASATAATILLARLVWAFPARGLDIEPDDSLSQLIVVAASALAGGAIVFSLARPGGRAILSGLRAISGPSLVIALVLSLALPVQALLEAQSYMGLSRGRAATVDLSIVEADYAANLDASFAAALASDPTTLTGPLNLLLITVDALRSDHVGACGNPWIQTPSMDLLARYGALSCDTYTHQPQSNPAFASILTSTYPAVHGVRAHMVDRLPDSFETLAELLARDGYATAAILPWTALDPAFSGFHQGFEVYEAYVLNTPATLENPVTATLGALYRRATDQVAIAGAVEAVLGMREQVEEESDGRADITAAAALQWLSANPRSPFFLWVHFFDPHYPWTAPEPWNQLYEDGSYEGPYDGSMGFVYEMHQGIFEPDPRDVQYLRALYASEVSYADYYVGQLLGYLAQLGLLDTTIIVLTGDHGESLGERGGPWPEGDYWLHGDDLYSPAIRVPLMVYDPRRSEPPLRLIPPVQHIDIMPTVLELLALPIPRQAQGRSIVPLMEHKEDGRDRIAVTTLDDDRATSIIAADGWKLIVNSKAGTRELYHLPTDPGERFDRAAIQPRRAAMLAAQLESWARSNGSRSVATADREEMGG